MPQPSNLDRVSVHGIIASVWKNEFRGSTYHFCKITTVFGDIICQLDPTLNPSQPVVGTIGDFTIGCDHQVRHTRDGAIFIESKRWLVEF